MSIFLKSSLFTQKDFLRFKIERDISERKSLSEKILSKNYIPVVIDSLDKTVSEKLSKSAGNDGYKIHGRCCQYDKNMMSDDIILDLKNRLSEIIPSGKKISLGLENGDIIKNNTEIGLLYSLYKNPTDDLLYLIITFENTIYGYLLSIFKYIFSKNSNENDESADKRKDLIKDMKTFIQNSKLEKNDATFTSSYFIYNEYKKYSKLLKPDTFTDTDDVETMKLMAYVIYKTLNSKQVYNNGKLGFYACFNK